VLALSVEIVENIIKMSGRIVDGLIVTLFPSPGAAHPLIAMLIDIVLGKASWNY